MVLMEERRRLLNEDTRSLCDNRKEPKMLRRNARRTALAATFGALALFGPTGIPTTPPTATYPADTTFPGPYDASTGVTPTEYAAEACVEPQAPLRAADGDQDLCYERTVALARGAEVLSPATFIGAGR